MYNIKLFTLFLTLTIFCISSSANPKKTSVKPKTVKEIIALTNKYCGSCHAPPSPQLLPKKSWPYVVQIMAEMAEENMGTPYISEEHIRDITAYYYGSSPSVLPLLPYHSAVPHNRNFVATNLVKQSTLPMITNINSVNLFKHDNSEFLVCDNENNHVSLLSISQDSIQEKVLADIKAPSHTEVVDFDLDGDQDIIVSSLGLFFTPEGKRQGKVTLLRQLSSGEFEKETLLENVGRVTDSKTLDIDGDNDLDIALAIFGADVPGELAWLENKGKNEFIKHTLMTGSGGLNISPIDLNKDGLIDFVSLITQQHELVAGLINRGDGTFKKVRLFQAAHPLVGFTSLKTVDLDGDNDLDLLLTNGDANDLQTDPKPYHGVQWLENKGNLQFEYRDIARFYGAVSSAVADLDKDGDLDIVVSSWNNYWDDPKRHSIIWFENDGKQTFTRHNINAAPKSITGLALADVTGNGFLDIVAGVFRMDLLNQRYKQKDKTAPSVIHSKRPLDRITVLENIKVLGK